MTVTLLILSPEAVLNVDQVALPVIQVTPKHVNLVLMVSTLTQIQVHAEYVP